jgi:hypothetical protein
MLHACVVSYRWAASLAGLLGRRRGCQVAAAGIAVDVRLIDVAAGRAAAMTGGTAGSKTRPGGSTGGH